MTPRLRSLAAALVLAAMTALSATSAWARPGGGQDYRGSSPGSSGGSASVRHSVAPSTAAGDANEEGDGSANPWVVVPPLLLFIAGFFIFVVRDTRSAPAARGSGQAGAPAPTPPVPPALADTRFQSRARALFEALNAAWMRRDLSPVRTRLSDATFQRLTTQLRLLQAQGLRNATSDWALQELRAVASEQDRTFDTLHVHVRAQGRDRDVPSHLEDDEARAAANEAPLHPYEERWTFLRRRDASVASDADGACPGCGAPLELGETAACAHCKAIVNSGKYDWVLAEMTQAVEARAPAPLPPGADALREQDPGFSRQVLEDRASLLFWRWVQAQATQDTRVLAKVATPEFLEQVASDISGRAPRSFQQCAVGAVALTALRLELETQHAFLEVRWSVERSPRRSVLELRRSAGAQTPEASLSTARCPACSGPLGDNGQPTCEYCGELLAASPRDWVLAGVVAQRAG